ncbi:hypothetical protein CBR_g34975 [Chara braunii]|uniref:EF-hand domain-containing protein n=1 Tax=Chara braunii TaxID=69332 RepID=A0A388LJV9_CHABU|nr:hypothetical protein CBR_g34975 [Chara braunii]|eukprot:GBG82606.1 hypothetical protein CBR_g34975 [Chara braunii]
MTLDMDSTLPVREALVRGGGGFDWPTGAFQALEAQAARLRSCLCRHQQQHNRYTIDKKSKAAGVGVGKAASSAPIAAPASAPALTIWAPQKQQQQPQQQQQQQGQCHLQYCHGEAHVTSSPAVALPNNLGTNEKRTRGRDSWNLLSDAPPPPPPPPPLHVLSSIAALSSHACPSSATSSSPSCPSAAASSSPRPSPASATLTTTSFPSAVVTSVNCKSSGGKRRGGCNGGKCWLSGVSPSGVRGGTSLGRNGFSASGQNLGCSAPGGCGVGGLGEQLLQTILGAVLVVGSWPPSPRRRKAEDFGTHCGPALSPPPPASSSSSSSPWPPSSRRRKGEDTTRHCDSSVSPSAASFSCSSSSSSPSCCSVVVDNVVTATKVRESSSDGGGIGKKMKTKEMSAEGTVTAIPIMGGLPARLAKISIIMPFHQAAPAAALRTGGQAEGGAERGRQATDPAAADEEAVKGERDESLPPGVSSRCALDSSLATHYHSEQPPPPPARTASGSLGVPFADLRRVTLGQLTRALEKTLHWEAGGNADHLKEQGLVRLELGEVGGVEVAAEVEGKSNLEDAAVARDEQVGGINVVGGRRRKRAGLRQHLLAGGGKRAGEARSGTRLKFATFARLQSDPRSESEEGGQAQQEDDGVARSSNGGSAAATIETTSAAPPAVPRRSPLPPAAAAAAAAGSEHYDGPPVGGGGLDKAEEDSAANRTAPRSSFLKLLASIKMPRLPDLHAIPIPISSSLVAASLSDIADMVPVMRKGNYPDRKRLVSVQDFYRYTEAEGRRLFDELDRDGDGQVTLEDLEVAMKKRRLPQDYAKCFLRRTRKHFLAKSFGWEDFRSLMDEKEPSMLRAFNSLNLTASGTLQKGQVLASLKRAGLPATDDNADAMIRFLNADLDGRIAYGHFRNFLILLPRERLGDDPSMVWFEAATVVPMVPPSAPVGSVLKSALAGGLVSGLSTSMMYPLDTLKTRVQASTLSLSEVLARVPEAGVRGLYRGAVPAIVGQFSSHGLRTGVMEVTKLLLKNVAPDLPAMQVQSLASLSSTIIGTAFRIPCEVMKQRLQAGLYKNLGEAIAGTMKMDGIKGFFRGTGVTLCREVPFYVAGMVIYEEMKKVANSLLKRQLKPWETIAVGGLSGGLAAIMTTPFDVMKTRMMTSSPGTTVTMSGIAWSIIRNEGALTLFKGCLPRFFWIAPLGAMNFAGYELAKRAMEKKDEEQEVEGYRRLSSPALSASTKPPPPDRKDAASSKRRLKTSSSSVGAVPAGLSKSNARETKAKTVVQPF